MSQVVYLLIPTSNHNDTVTIYTEEDVVYLLIPTSNHNLVDDDGGYLVLYIFWFLHQTTTVVTFAAVPAMLYIFWFLHQTTTVQR